MRLRTLVAGSLPSRSAVSSSSPVDGSGNDGTGNDGTGNDGIGDDVGDVGRIRTGPWSAAAVRGLLLLTVLAVGVAGYLLWQAQPRPVATVPEVLAAGEPVTGNLPPVESTGTAPPPPTSAPSVPMAEAPPALPDVIVHVAGQVARPGLVRLPGGSRVADAVEAAGGVTRPRAAESVNLARLVVDGEQIYVGGSGGAEGLPAATGAGAVATASPLDLNTATVEQFDALPGVGPVIAGRIVEWRTLHGRFRSVEELAEVSGIGDAILANLRPLVRV